MTSPFPQYISSITRRPESKNTTCSCSLNPDAYPASELPASGTAENQNQILQDLASQGYSGIAVSTILGRFVIPIYYVLGERLIDHFARGRSEANPSHPPIVEDRVVHHAPAHEQVPAGVH